MAHKKAGGSSRNGRDSQSKRLGVKKFGLGKDHTLFALCDCRVAFRDGKLGRKYVHIEMPAEAQSK